jgi:hypothetical protein
MVTSYSMYKINIGKNGGHIILDILATHPDILSSPLQILTKSPDISAIMSRY